MAELPEIAKLAGQMRDTLRGKTIRSALLLQEKCANVPQEQFQSRAAGAKIDDVYYKGKWIIHRLDSGENILLSLGMGADILYFEDEKNAAEKHHIKVLFPTGAATRPASGGSESSCSSQAPSWKRSRIRGTSAWTPSTRGLHRSTSPPS